MKPYYQDDAVTIYHGDCLGLIDELPEVDHVITDPPYSEQAHKGAKTGSWSKGGGEGTRKLVTFKNITAEYLHSMVGSLRFRRWFIATVDYTLIPPLYESPPDGLDFVRFGMWNKNGTGAPQFTGDRPAQGWEAIAMLHPKGKKRWNGGGKAATYTIPAVRSSIYSTEKPLDLIASFVLDFTDPNDLILDPFCGSGVSLFASKMHERRSIGIDISEEACEIAARRCEFNRAACRRMDQGVLKL